MADQIEELREKVLSALFRNERPRSPPFLGSILRGEMIREGDAETLAESSGRI